MTAARRAAYEVLRRTFEQGAWTDRAFPAAAERHGLDPRERAQAQRLAYGAVQRRGTADHVVEGAANRPVHEIDPPLTAALRLGVYELLFAAATPDHAAVDQAVELAKCSPGWATTRRRRRPSRTHFPYGSRGCGGRSSAPAPPGPSWRR